MSKPFTNHSVIGGAVKGYAHPDFYSVADKLSAQIKRAKNWGGAVTVYHKGECVVDIWGGFKDQYENPWQEDTLALSFSTGKGIASTLLHIYADRGLVDYDEPVAKYWPEFAQAGKQNITVRQILSHQAGLYNFSDIIEDENTLYDWEKRVALLAQAKPVHKPGEAYGYHAFTYGELVGEICQRVGKKPLAELLKEEVSDPLDLDGLFIGLPESELGRVATYPKAFKAGYPVMEKLIKERRDKEKGPLTYIVDKAVKSSKLLNAFGFKGAERSVIESFNSPALFQSGNASIGGVFTARSLAKVYDNLLSSGDNNSKGLISAKTLSQIQKQQVKGNDRILLAPNLWCLGYHQINLFGFSKSGFGHAGSNGSAAFADPKTGLAFAVTNTEQPVCAMTRLMGMSRAVAKCV